MMDGRENNMMDLWRNEEEYTTRIKWSLYIKRLHDAINIFINFFYQIYNVSRFNVEIAALQKQKL